MFAVRDFSLEVRFAVSGHVKDNPLLTARRAPRALNLVTTSKRQSFPIPNFNAAEDPYLSS